MLTSAPEWIEDASTTHCALLPLTTCLADALESAARLGCTLLVCGAGVAVAAVLVGAQLDALVDAQLVGAALELCVARAVLAVVVGAGGVVHTDERHRGAANSSGSWICKALAVARVARGGVAALRSAQICKAGSREFGPA